MNASHPDAAGNPAIVGREAELRLLVELMCGGAPARGAVLTGEPGIGKTTLWEDALATARDGTVRVLVARASEAEARLAFAGLIDLLDGVDVRRVPRLPAPQAAALETALRRADPGASAPEPGALALGLLTVIRELSAVERVLIAIDDVHVLDAPSAEALAFAGRRLEREPVGFLLTRRPGEPYALENILRARGVRELDLGPLSIGAIRRLLAERLGLALPRPLLRRLVETTLGNPFFALEVGRELVDRGLPAFGDELPVSDAVEGLLGTRVARLAAPIRRVLLAVALDADLRREQVAEIAGEEAVDEAFEAGLLRGEGDRLRPAHPLLAAAARTRARAGERRELHGRLAEIVADEELRARHLALSADGPSEELATTVAAAAARASARGARQEAVELADHALRLTPAGSGGRADRLLALADHLQLAGEKRRAAELLLPELDSIPSGPARARALVVLAAGVVTSSDDIDRYVERATVASRDDPALHVVLRGVLAVNAGFLSLSELAAAESRGQEALRAARRSGPELERIVLDALAWVRVIRGRPVDDFVQRYSAISDVASYIAASPDRAAAQRLAWRGEVQAARALLARLYSLADEREELASYALLRLHLCELELRAARLDAAERLLEEWAESSDRELPTSIPYQRCRALLAAARGLPEEADRWSEETITGAEATGNRWDVLEALRARAVAALLRRDFARAAESLRVVWDHTRREGIDEPGAFPVAPDLVEALLELGEAEEAGAVTARLGELAESQEHPWGLATAKRCDALVRGREPGLEAAAAAYGDLGLPLDQARSLLLLGRAARRRRGWAAARIALERAADLFDAIDASGWAAEARSELARVSARRRPASGALTEAERRVVGLAIEGCSNKEIAQALFVTVNTVERHLSHAYAKLGVRSRAQLARVYPSA